MRQRPAIALAGGLALAMNLGNATAQERPAAPRPPAATAATPPAAAAPAPMAPTEPPCKAIALNQQEEILRLNDFITQLQQQIVRLQRGLLEQAKRNAEPDIVKEAGGTADQGWDFERNALRPAAPPATVPPPAAPPKP